MIRKIALLSLCVVAGSLGCAGERLPPKALIDARADFNQAQSGLAAQLDPTDVHEADLALQRAEQAFRDDPDAPTTVDLALIADRKALIASSEATTSRAMRDAEAAKAQLDVAKTQKLAKAESSLQATQNALGQTEVQLRNQQALTAAEAARRQELEGKLKDARDTLAKIAAVKDDARGVVITLQGEVLFETGKHELKAGAMAKLAQIAEVLKGKDQPIEIYGFTDSTGTRDANMTLSRERAEAVRSFLVGKGVPADLVKSEGKGPDQPIAENTSPDGRAQNRRVEIVVEPKK